MIYINGMASTAHRSRTSVVQRHRELTARRARQGRDDYSTGWQPNVCPASSLPTTAW
ncbi:MAG: hypothetical protein ACE5JZ_00060 [Kiloniellales bacterium]